MCKRDICIEVEMAIHSGAFSGHRMLCIGPPLPPAAPPRRSSTSLDVIVHLASSACDRLPDGGAAAVVALSR